MKFRSRWSVSDALNTMYMRIERRGATRKSGGLHCVDRQFVS